MQCNIQWIQQTGMDQKCPVRRQWSNVKNVDDLLCWTDYSLIIFFKCNKYLYLSVYFLCMKTNQYSTTFVMSERAMQTTLPRERQHFQPSETTLWPLVLIKDRLLHVSPGWISKIQKSSKTKRKKERKKHSSLLVVLNQKCFSFILSTISI